MSRYLEYSVIYRQPARVFAGGGAGESGFLQNAASGRNQNQQVFLLLMYAVVTKHQLRRGRNTMKTFLHKYSSDVIGVLNGFDRLLFRGTLRHIVYPYGMIAYLRQGQVLLKDFSKHVLKVSSQLKEASKSIASKSSRPFVYLASSQTSKEGFAHELARKDSVERGLICVLSSVEPCLSFDINHNRQTRKLELISRWRKCLHLYHYYIHPIFGFMHGRIQTWFPFNIQICLNGREWLARQMDNAKLCYQRQDNCFTWIQDVTEAQRLMDQQLRTPWPKHLEEFARLLNPAHDEIFKLFPLHYYWSVMQSEWATDIMFRNSRLLANHYRTLVHHGMTTFSSPDVMRFLGRKIPATGNIPHHFTAEVVTDLKHRAEGIRVKHRVKTNTIKIYDKQGSVLRVETTLNDPSDFKVYRKKESAQATKPEWLPLRKGVADFHRRAQVCQNANERYLEALACAHDSTPLKNWTDKLCRPVTWKAKRFRALNPYAPDDARLFSAVARGEFFINGFTNKEIRILIYGAQTDTTEKRRTSAVITRQIRLLRAHRLLRKLPKHNRYHLTEKGKLVIAALLTAREADTISLTKLAA